MPPALLTSRTLRALAVECSHSAPNQSGAARAGANLHRPSNSLISTAVQPASPRQQHLQQQQQQLAPQQLGPAQLLLQQHQQHHQSPKMGRANSVVSNTAQVGGGGGASGPAGAPRPQGRAATPGSMFGGHGTLPRARTRHQSPAHGSHQAGGEQVRAGLGLQVLQNQCRGIYTSRGLCECFRSNAIAA